MTCPVRAVHCNSTFHLSIWGSGNTETREKKEGKQTHNRGGGLETNAKEGTKNGWNGQKVEQWTKSRGCLSIRSRVVNLQLSP